jgi:hypothetical protein
MQTNLLLVAGLALAAVAILYAGIRIGRGRGAALPVVPEGVPAAARLLVGTWQGRQVYAFAAAISAASADVLFDGVEILAPAGARLSVQPGEDGSWTRPARRHAVRWCAVAGKRETVVQCRLHLPASAQREGTRARLRLTGAQAGAGDRCIHVMLRVDL